MYSRVDSREILLNLQPSMTGTAHLAGKLAGTAAALLKKKHGSSLPPHGPMVVELSKMVRSIFSKIPLESH